MGLKIKGQLVLVSVILSLLPIAITGLVAYYTARDALETRIRFNLETLATETLKTVERILLERNHNLQAWAKLRFIQDDTVTSDADLKISQFLQDAKKNFDFYQEIWVANTTDGRIISTTLSSLSGRDVREYEWFQRALRGEPWVGDPALQDTTGKVGMPLSFPIRASFKGTQVVGVLVAVLDWEKIVELLNAVKVLPEGQTQKGYLTMTDSRGVVLSYPGFLGAWEPGKSKVENVGLQNIPLQTNSAAGSEEVVVQNEKFLLGFATTDKKPYLPGTWSAVLLMRSDVAFAPINNIMWTVILLFVVLGAGSAAVSVYWANRFSRPITYLAPFLNSVASGDLSGTITVSRKDELGVLAQAANEMSAKLREVIQEIQQAGLQITTAVTQILSAAEDHASGSAEQAASIAEVTATMEELTNTAKQISEQATSVKKTADDNAQAAHAGYQSVSDGLEAMEKIRSRVEDITDKILSLGERSQRISEVLNLIKEIAGEIHLLAVNAAIESAAAGEHGKRFAVVASEVRRLAEKTRESTEEIKGIVGEIQSATNTSVLATEQGVREVESGVVLAKRARGSLEEILQMVDRTTQAIRQITLATQQQRSASEQIVQTMREVAEVTKESAAGMKQSATSVAELSHLADQFKTRIKEFRF